MSILSVSVPSEAANSIKIKYNGKVRTNKSTQMSVSFDGKTISKAGYKALVINGAYMVPYTDIFKSGTGATCTYSKTTKELVIAKHDVTLKMTVGKKTAYINDEKVTMPAAPLSVRFVKKKKTKILVPVSFVAKTLHYGYQKSDGIIQLTSPYEINVDGNKIYYTDVKGNVLYNHNLYSLESLPALKLSGSWYLPAEETLQTIMGLEYRYDTEKKTITVSNEEVDLNFRCKVDSTEATLNSEKITLKQAPKIIQRCSDNMEVVCIPAAEVLKHIGYTRNWDKQSAAYSIQTKNYFAWQKKLTETQKSDTAKNYIHSLAATYTNANGMGSINLSVQGSVADIVKKVTIKRTKDLISITLPTTEYLLDKNQFSNFGEIIEKMDIVQESDGTTTITLDCYVVADYSYTIQNDLLEINILYIYGNANGSVTDYSLQIPKPAGVTIEQVTNKDQYANKRFKIYIAGDYVEYFTQNPIIINNNSVKSVAITKNETHTIITVKTSSLRGYKILEQNKSFVVSIGAPKKIYKNIVVLDAGHGGFDPGAQNKGTNEKDLNFKILYTYMKDYFESNAPDIKVYWTRTTDTYLTLADRAAFAKKVGADAFISLHMNSSVKTSANGTEVYYSVSNNSTSFSGINSKKMATLFKDQLIGDLKTKNRGTKTAGYYVLKHNTVPSILIELGFLSGSSDYSKLTKTSFQKKAAKSIYTAITAMFNQYDTGR